MKVWLPAVRAGSGADVYTERLAAALRRHGHQAVITWLPLWWEPIAALGRVRPPDGTDLIHANSWNAFAYTKFGKPVVATVHLCVHDSALLPYKTLAQRLYHRWLIRAYEQRSYKSVQAIVAVSDHTRSSVISQFGHRAISVIHNWVDTDLFRPAGETAQRFGTRPFRLLYAGNRSVRKGWDVLPELMSRLGPNFELQIACGLRGDAPKLNLPPNTQSLGAIRDEADMVRAYQQCDALIMPSRLEGFGYVTAEAMACGKPVVAFDNSAAPELIGDGESGLLVATDDLRGMAAACQQLANTPGLAHRIGRAARQRVETRFAESAAVPHYLRLYGEVLGGAAPATVPLPR